MYAATTHVNLQPVTAAARNHVDVDPTSTAKTLHLDGISKQFGETVALQPVTLEVPAGQLLSLLGPSGCGKTTTLRLIAGFEYPNTGRIRISGKDITQLPPNRRGLGMVFQNYSLFPHLSVAENIAFGLKMAGVPRQSASASVQKMLDMIQLPGYGDRRISQLSGGQQQRIALARALITNPSILLLDEPLGALDKNLREGMQFELRKLQRELGITTVLVTHDQEEALTMSDCVVVMERGSILQIGSPREVYERPRTRFVAEFLGTANIFHARAVATAGEGLRLRIGAVESANPIEMICANARDGRTREQLLFAVRPEKIVLNGVLPEHVSFAGAVVEHVFRGSQHAYLIEVPELGTRLYAHVLAGTKTSGLCVAGDSVSVSFNPSDAVVLEDAVGTH